MGEMNASFMVPGAPCEAQGQTAAVASDEKLDWSGIIAMFNIWLRHIASNNLFVVVVVVVSVLHQEQTAQAQTPSSLKTRGLRQDHKTTNENYKIIEIRMSTIKANLFSKSEFLSYFYFFGLSLLKSQHSIQVSL